MENVSFFIQQDLLIPEGITMSWILEMTGSR